MPATTAAPDENIQEQQQQQQQRPPLQTQLSSSVPSTPYQHARDSQYVSRSPSPRRGLGHHSPRSVVSEAIEPPAMMMTNGLRPVVSASAQVVCKFETAPEWRKRRIPYIDGGDQELAPPEKRPRSSLVAPEETDKLTHDVQELYERLLPSEESEQRRTDLVKKLHNMLNDEWPGNDIKVSVFGSSGNLLSSNDSDVDICVTTTSKKVENMHNLASLLHQNGMERVVCRAAAKVPIVKCWDPVLELACDINVNNPLAVENTRMIRTYVQLDPRVRPLAKVIKHWTKERVLNDAAFGGTISSYTWICMVINFLQQREPPILPSLQKITGMRSTINGRVSDFADDIEQLKGLLSANDNKETLADLLFHFFRYYAYEFEYSKYVVSVKEGRSLSRTEKGWDNPRNNKEARCRLCVEEPFNTSRNLGNSADDYAWSGIHAEIRRAFDLLSDGLQLEKCCERFIFPPEEKSTFQRPAPTSKPTILRSASQSGARPTHDGQSVRPRKGSNRNQSMQRNGNRRASSGAVFGQPRIPMLHSPSLSLAGVDYFAKQGDLHNQLAQQYQYLQAQQDVLTRQFMLREQQQQQQQQQQKQQHHTQSSSQQQQQSAQQTPGGSPHLRQYAFTNPRLFDNNAPPQTAPLLPGALYHYPARYPPASPAMMQRHGQRSRDGSVTNPPSPSLSNATLRQSTASVDGSTSTVRSQSQPGRSLRHPITNIQQTHPGYDVSGALNMWPGSRSSQYYLPNGYPYQLSSMPPPFQAGGPLAAESAGPKEYVGYYVGQSPQLGPQYVAQGQVPPLPLGQPPPARQRQVSPELHPPAIANGTNTSRSPSPLEPSVNESARLEPEGPVIANGSTPLPTVKSKDKTLVNGGAAVTANGQHGLGLDVPPPLSLKLPSRSADDGETHSKREKDIALGKTQARTSPHLTLSPNGKQSNGYVSSETNAPTAAPLYSLVAELRTPSPTLSHRLEQPDVLSNGIDKHAKIASAKLAEENANPMTKLGRSVLDLKLVQARSGLQQSTTAPLTAPQSAGLPPTQDKNPWQQAVSKKGHRKNKSMANATVSMQRSPIEAERKGG